MEKPVRPSAMTPVLVALLAIVVCGSVTSCGGGMGTKHHALPPTPHSVFQDSFTDSTLDSDVWVAHGEGVSVANGLLRIVSREPWEAGAESIEHFFRPRGADYLTIRGAVYCPADTFASTAIVNIQDRWRPDDPDCYFFEFARNREFAGDNEAFFGAKVDGVVREHVSLGSFNNDSTVYWTLTVYEGRCEAEVGSRSHATSLDVYDLGLSFHGSGSVTYWDFAEVTLWEVH